MKKQKLNQSGVGMLVEIIIFAVIFGAIGSAAYVVMQSRKVDPQTTFRNYIVKGLSTSKIAQDQITKEGSSSSTGKAQLDAGNKQIIINIDAECSSTIDNNRMTVGASYRLENSKRFIRINKVTGSYSLPQGASVDLGKYYNKALGKWYAAPGDDEAIKAQLDNGVFAFSNILTSPSSDAQKIADKIINDKVFTYTSFKKVKAGYSFELTSHKDKYEQLLKDSFPKLTQVDTIIDNIFISKDTNVSTVTVDKDGNLITDTGTDSNVCYDTIYTVLGTKPDDVSETIKYTSKTIDYDSANIEKIKTSFPVEDLSKDVSQ